MEKGRQGAKWGGGQGGQRLMNSMGLRSKVSRMPFALLCQYPQSSPLVTAGWWQGQTPGGVAALWRHTLAGFRQGSYTQ